jgi:hypothetical protein
VIAGGDHTFSKAAARGLLRQELRAWLGISSS